ncbi:MAG: hypothetical protein HWD61_15845 [Parachlamydiaceae bacterium]|nr:MAG: hypothetical protein HWD61_15845 [Parachlamydiaceae bacterium]
MVNSLDGRENNNKIFIDIENRHDRTGLTHYSIHSHRLRTIISKILRLFCCCFKTTHEYRTANQELRSSYFGFETFEINLNEKVYYITKASYEKWKLANLLPFFNSDFSQDFLQLIKTSKVTLNSKETDPKGLKAEISGPGFKITHLSHSEQGELPQDINLSHAYQDADFNNLWKRTDLFHNLSGSTSVSQNPDSQASTPLVVNDAQTLIAAFEREDKELKPFCLPLKKKFLKRLSYNNLALNKSMPSYRILQSLLK